MKTEYKVIVLSIIFGLLVWVVDVAIDYLIFYKESFELSPIYNIPAHEIYMRSFIILSFLIFGILISRVIVKRKQAEEETKKSEEKYHNLIEFANVGIIVAEKYKITQVNRKAEEIYGYSEGELIGQSPAILVPEKYRKQHQEILNEILKSGKGKKMTFEEEGVGKDGSLFPVEISFTLTQPMEKDIIAVMRDITERKRTEEELRGTKDYLDNIIESSLDGIVTGDSKGNIVSTNEAFLKLIGYRNEEIIGKHVMELSITEKGTYESTTGETVKIDEEFFNDARKMTYEKLFKEGKITNWETYYLCRDRKIVPVEQNIVYLYNEEEDITGSVGIIRDITERRKTEKKIKEAGEFLENIFKTTADGILVTDNEGLITMVNEATEKMLGYSKEEIIGKGADIFKPEGEQYEVTTKKYLTKFFEEGVVTAFELTWLRKDENLIDIEANATFLKDNKGNVTGSVASIRDITKRKKMEHKFLQSEKLKSLGELAHGVAHDFNNVLAAILGRAQLLKMIVETPQGKEERRRSVIEMKEGLEVIEKASRDGAETVRRIQEFARRRDEDKYFTTINLNEIIENALEFTKVRWKDDAESKGIKINIQKELSSLPPISGSAAELREVFTNIINNALDAIPQGGKIKIKTFKEDSHISIKVKDTGVGIPKIMRDRIFDPFFTTKGVKSSGLGLSVSYGIINRHRGTITVDSVEGEGTSFIIKLPISEKVIETEQVKPIPEEQRKAKILVIEDEEQVLNLLSAILISGGHEVETASDGTQGIKMFKKKDFDLVFTDLGMPGMSGWQVAEKVKSINKNVPVALITGWNVELNESEMRESGVDLLIYKPFEVNQVLKLVQEGMVLRDRFKAA